MSATIDPDRLDNVHHSGVNIEARCPACHEEGGDNYGNHLIIYPTGQFGCVLYPGDDGIEHRKRIFELAGSCSRAMPRAKPRPKPQKARTTHSDLDQLARACTPKGGKFVELYYYPQDGRNFAAVARYELPGDKTFVQYHFEGEGWQAGGPSGYWPLYKAESIPKGATVHVVEGEKCQHVASAIGLTVTTSAGGSKAAVKSNWTTLAGREVVIVPDNDEPGQAYARKVASILLALTPPATVKIKDLPGVPSDGGDIVDWIEARRNDGMADPDIRMAFEALPSAPIVHTQAESPTDDQEWTSQDVRGDVMPEPTPLPKIDSVEPFTFDMLPATIAPWVEDIVERMQCQPDIVAVPAVISMGVLVGCKVGIRPKRHDDWVEVPNLWGAAIGRPGTLKTPAISEALGPLRRIEHEESERFAQATQNHEAQLAAWETEAAAAAPEIKAAIKNGDTEKANELKRQLPERPPEPGRQRLIVNDTTVEALGEVLRANSNGVLAFRDELTGWLKCLEKDNQRDARAFYLEAWNGKHPFTTDRIGRGTIEIKRAIISIMGGIQPGPLQAYLAGLDGSGDDGLLQRFQLIVWPDTKNGWRNVDRYPDKIARDTAFAVYERLHDMTAQGVMATLEDGAIPYLRFCGDAQDAFTGWRETLEARLAEGSMPDAMQAHLAKYRKLVPSLALLFTLADGGKGCVDAAALNKAIGWARYLEPHARRLYGSRRNSPVNLASKLLDKIKSRAVKDGFTVRDVYRHQWSDLGDQHQVQNAIQVLVEHGYLLEQLRRESGRPCKVYRTNPLIWETHAANQPTEPPEAKKQTIVEDVPDASVSSGSPNSSATVSGDPNAAEVEPSRDPTEPPEVEALPPEAALPEDRSVSYGSNVHGTINDIRRDSQAFTSTEGLTNLTQPASAPASDDGKGTTAFATSPEPLPSVSYGSGISDASAHQQADDQEFEAIPREVV